jgi:transcriptional regulator with XRE-family HTH domain
MNIYLGKTARQFRETLGLSQRAMAAELGITPVHLCNIENNKALPSQSLLDRYRERWDVDLYVLAWCLHGDVYRLPPRLRKAAAEIAATWQAELRKKLRSAERVGNG